MIQVTLNLYPKLKSGDVNLEFLLVDGKRAKVKYISDQLVPVEELHAFTLDGLGTATVALYRCTVT